MCRICYVSFLKSFLKATAFPSTDDEEAPVYLTEAMAGLIADFVAAHPYHRSGVPSGHIEKVPYLEFMHILSCERPVESR